jgi:hypothetical protein
VPQHPQIDHRPRRPAGFQFQLQSVVYRAISANKADSTKVRLPISAKLFTLRELTRGRACGPFCPFQKLKLAWGRFNACAVFFSADLYAQNEILGELQIEGNTDAEKTAGVWVDG